MSFPLTALRHEPSFVTVVDEKPTDEIPRTSLPPSASRDRGSIVVAGPTELYDRLAFTHPDAVVNQPVIAMNDSSPALL
jgi:hypothetical protein